MTNETPLFDEYIALVEVHGMNSEIASDFRNRHPEMSDVFVNVGELERAGHAARVARGVTLAGWGGAFLCVALLGLFGIERGIHLTVVNAALSDATSRLEVAESDRKELSDQYKFAM